MKTFEFIKKTLVEMHKKCTTDQYGQVSKHNFQPHIFGERVSEVRDFCKKKGTLRFSTYGSSFGTYEAFTIQDEKIQSECQKALSKNKNYLQNINSWL